ncbi:hypothetical protein ACWEO4_43775 [Streptomyces sp. NPDC004393]
MSGGYQVDPDALKTVAKGINEAIDELKSLGSTRAARSAGASRTSS